MSTRGAYGFRLNNKDYVTYNHFDSYPSGLGVDILKQTKKLVCAKGGLNGLKSSVAGLRSVDPDSTPAASDIRRCRPYWDTSVGRQTINDWYCLLRGTQGNLEAMLETGVLIDKSAFLIDSLFCEHAYIVNLDTHKLEVYQGFNIGQIRNGAVTPKWSSGRYAQQLRPEDAGKTKEEPNSFYFGVVLTNEFALRKLPAEHRFITLTNKKLEN